MEALESVEIMLTRNQINEAVDALHHIVNSPLEGQREEAVKVKEVAILKLGEVLSKHGFADSLGGLIERTRGMIDMFTKAKAAKLIRELVDMFLKMDATTGKEVALCQQCIDWAKQENRVYLRQALQARLIAVLVEKCSYSEALQLASILLKELKKIDDKALLVEVQLLESQAFQKLGNINRGRASLTSAKTTANGIYCPPKLQASLDLQSGILHAEEKDFKTAYSYFYEAFENYDSIDHPSAILALKYMLLCKIMLNTPDEVQSIVTGKLALRYAGPQLEAMQQIAKASQNRSIAEFEKTIGDHREYVAEDPIVKSHLDALYDNLLQQNLLRIIEPFSHVEVSHVAELINLPLDLVERKLSQMILDTVLHGILDQGKGVLIVFEDSSVDQTYTSALDSISQLGKVVDSLYKKAQRLQ